MTTLPTLDESKIITYNFPASQYYQEVATKKQLVIHHTVSGPDANTIFANWAKTAERVATSFVIGGKGEIVQGFSSKFWAHHLGLTSSNNTVLNKAAIAIEVCNWGGLTEKGGKYFSYFNTEVPASEVIDYGQTWRGYRYFHKYNAAQVEALRQLLNYLADKYTIAKTYNSDMWDISQNALAGKNGIYTHVSYRKDKSDMHPQPELISMLRGLGK